MRRRHTEGFIGSSSGATCANQDSRKRCGSSQTDTAPHNSGQFPAIRPTFQAAKTEELTRNPVFWQVCASQRKRGHLSDSVTTWTPGEQKRICGRSQHGCARKYSPTVANVLFGECIYFSARQLLRGILRAVPSLCG